jgi:hypothetical protein
MTTQPQICSRYLARAHAAGVSDLGYNYCSLITKSPRARVSRSALTGAEWGEDVELDAV